MGACSYGYDEDGAAVVCAAGPVLAPVAREAHQRLREKEREEQEVQRNRRVMARERMSWNKREGRKRDLGQSSGDKNFVEEEKRILRQQFEH